MTRHSKQNTALGHFTYAEYQMLKDRWGSQSMRLSQENVRAFNACYLCLQTAQRPVSCMEGHLYCKECILTDLVKQKAQLASHAQRRAELLRKRSEKEAETKATEAADKIAQFEQGSAIMPKKRKVENDQDTASSKKRTSDDSHVSKAATMPAFWLPSMAPEYEQDDEALLEEDRASITLCTASASHPHKLLSKQLVDVHFSERTVQNDKQVYCPCCKKECSRVSQTFVLRRCGHVLCAPCTKTLIQGPLAKEEPTACPDCSMAVKKERDVISLVREGTGFAGGGTAEAKSKGIAFQG